IHNNCSGKHAAMLALCRACDWELASYHDRAHPLQVAVREELARWIDADPERLPWGTDGCGVPTPALSLSGMAKAYARLGASDDPGPRAVVGAMTRNPNLISGPRAFSASLMRETGGRLLGKEGAEGVFCVACPGAAWGAAFKVGDGAMRALGPAVLWGLERLDLIGRAELDRLASFRRVAVHNTRGEEVAYLQADDDAE
ncbi:MAG: asparaginase, partial [Gemmatimonadetes bacterium]|nr:asparaginase [Gemmatimonadota bacterium]